MTTMDDLIADWKRTLATIDQQLELLTSGKMGTGNKVIRSTTADTIARLKRARAELDALLKEHHR